MSDMVRITTNIQKKAYYLKNSPERCILEETNNMSAELRTEPVQAGRNVFQVWNEILEKRPEVVRQTAKVYVERPHGTSDVQVVEVLPRERILWSDSSQSFFGQPGEIKAIGAVVELRPDDFDPTVDYTGADRWFNEGDSLDMDPKRSKSFIFADFESEPSPELLDLTIKTLDGWNSDWYLLINKLIDSKDLPKYYGQLIMDMSKNLSPVKSKLYGHIGKYLIENADDKHKLKLWVDDILEKIGHSNEHSENSKLVFPIDLRYIAHVLDGLVGDTINEGYLRVSEKHGSVPVLIAQQVNEQVIIYQPEDDPFNRSQPRLPNF
jgi:hypothetical protein